MKLLHKDAVAHGQLTSLCGKMFYYDGQNLSTKLIDFQAFDDDCAVHEQWTPVLPSSLTADATVREALLQICLMLSVSHATIYLENDCFVDYVVERTNDRRTDVMVPGRSVAQVVEQSATLGGVLFSNLYQHEYHEIDDCFPYQDYRLSQLGIPVQDVLHVIAEGKEYYLEMKEL